MSESRRIRIGNQTAFSATPLEPFEYAVANGFDAFEFFPDKKKSGEGWEESVIPGELRSRIKDTARNHDIRLSVHSPWPSDPSNAENRPALSGTVQFARAIGAKLFNIHLSSTKGVAAYLEAITPLAEELADPGIALSIENTPDTTPEDFNEFFSLIDGRGSPDLRHIGMCLDLGHANLCRSTRNDYLGFIDALGPHVPLIHIHMHENYGDLDSHLPLFTGPAGRDPSGIAGFVERMNKRAFSGSIILEQWPQPQRLLNEARNRLLEMIRNTEKTDVFFSDDFVKKIADANDRFLSWRKRLEWIEKLLTGDAAPLTLEQLAYVAIYLHFIGTGQVRCGEDGGHYRPSVHAATARRIYRRLVRISSPENCLVIRKIYPWLPSFDREFIRAEPLTRIRDIAHRNDIPGELKKEIKETLQNKLHRSAGPEDLATSEKLLARIAAPDADYPPAFVQEFRRFHEELRDFFHAGSLREELEKILREETIRDTGLVRDFLKALAEPEDDERAETNLELLTSLREKFIRRYADDTSANAQQLQLADVRLEDFSFVLLSRLINSIDSEPMPWVKALHCLCLIVRNLGLSGIDFEECSAIESELRTWSASFEAHDRTHLLRVKATLDRARRLAEVYCLRVLTLFSEKARTLGHALAVEEYAIEAFAEGEIRRHAVFQLSKLVSLLLRNIRALAGLPMWSAIVAGKACGRLVSAQELDGLSSSFDEPVVALVERAGGDEDAPAGLTGLIVAHETPLLSHLAVRARQRGLVFAACEEPDALNELRTHIGKHLLLNVYEGAVTYEISSDGKVPGACGIHGTSLRKEVLVPDVVFIPGQELLLLDDITLSTGGSKANAVRLLAELSNRDGAVFSVPQGVVIPFGVMERSLRISGIENEYRILMAGLNGLKADDFRGAVKRLQSMLFGLQVPEEIVKGVAKAFKRSERLMVRSSSSCEDLEGFTGAGLYDSIAGITPSKVARAVSAVWSSLWNTRAAIARRNAGIPHGKAHMAILIQEMLAPDFSFIMHTLNPANGAPDEVYIELAVGLGGTLASAGTHGAPYRIVFDKKTEETRTLAFANFSTALYPGLEGEIISKTVDYSGIRLSTDEDFRNSIVRYIGSTGRFVENEMGRPQDVEGVIRGNRLYLVQSRPQQENI